MCGRYRVKYPKAVEEALKAIFSGAMSLGEFESRFNVAPTQIMPIAHAAEGEPTLAAMMWGLIPYWETSPKPKLAPINARSGEAFAKPIFRQAIQKRRCLVPADGFYEWPKLETGLKQPSFFSLQAERPFFFAGIFENAVEGLRPATFTLFTTEPNALLARLPHERMPVILEGDQAKEWVGPGALSEAAFKQFCRPFPAEQMQSWPVSTLINRAGNEGPLCCEPVSAILPPPSPPKQTDFGF